MELFELRVGMDQVYIIRDSERNKKKESGTTPNSFNIKYPLICLAFIGLRLLFNNL